MFEEPSCPACQMSISSDEAFCQYCGGRLLVNGALVVAKNGDLAWSLGTVPRAKLIIKALRLRKQELTLIKRGARQQAQGLRATYTDQIRRQGSKVRGGGSVGAVIRVVQTVQRDGRRRTLAEELEHWELSQQQAAAQILLVDSAILKIQGVLLAVEGSK